ncbi:MAG: ISAs1 family transposase [Chitinophagales bacterium]
MPKKTVATIIEDENGYCIQVKRNQRNLYKQIKINIDSNKPISTHFSKEKNRGRTENRLVEIYDDITGISPEWIGLQRIIHVHRYGYRPQKDKKKDGHFDEHHYYILSKDTDDAKQVAQGIRAHWHIENRLHYVKDVVQNEDKSNIKGGYAIENLSLLKNGVINTFRMNGLQSIKEANIIFANKIKELFGMLQAHSYS